MQNTDRHAERDLANLVNMAGKMRMLSHRAVMFALLVPFDPSLAHARDKALDDFAELHGILADPAGAGGYGPGCVEALQKANAITPDQLSVVSDFLQKSKKMRAYPKGSADRVTELGEFVATDLLATLNEINDGIRRALDYLSQQRAASKQPIVTAIGETLGQIDRLASSLRMVATNASLEAQRSGDAGRVFRVLSDEMRILSDQSRASAVNLGDLLAKVRS